MTFTKRKPGRPPKPEGRMVHFAIRLPAELAAKLKALPPDVVRDALRKLVAN